MDPFKKLEAFEPTKKAYSLFEEFKAFAFKGNVVDLAVGVIIGAAFGKIVESLVKNIFMPLIAAIVPGQEGYVSWKWELNGSQIPYGLFLGEVVNFLLIALILFIFIRKFLSWMMRTHQGNAGSAVDERSGTSDRNSRPAQSTKPAGRGWLTRGIDGSCLGGPRHEDRHPRRQRTSRNHSRSSVHGRSGTMSLCSAASPRAIAVATVSWDAESLGNWTTEIDNADVVINLAGRNVNCRYTDANRKAILESRVKSTRDCRRSNRTGQTPAKGLAASEHGDDLRPPLRCSRMTRRPAFSAATRRTYPTPGDSASTWPRRGRRLPTKPMCRTRARC